jgi:hypothetical protein
MKLGKKPPKPTERKRTDQTLHPPLHQTTKMPSHRTDQARSPGKSSAALPFQLPFQFLKTLSLVTTGGAVTVGLLVLVGMWQSGAGFLDKLYGLLNPSAAKNQIDVRSMVVQQIRGASELTTARYSLETVVPTKRERTFGNYVVGTTTLLYIAYGEVEAGVDLSSLRPEDVTVLGDTLQITLPPPRVLDQKIDVSRSKVYDYNRGFLGLGPDVAPELQDFAQRETLNKITEAACQQGILQMASDRAKLTVSQLFSTAGYSNVLVETSPPAPDACTLPNPQP